VCVEITVHIQQRPATGFRLVRQTTRNITRGFARQPTQPSGRCNRATAQLGLQAVAALDRAAVVHPRVDHQAAQPDAADADDEAWPLDERREPSLGGEEDGKKLPTRDNVPRALERQRADLPQEAGALFSEMLQDGGRIHSLQRKVSGGLGFRVKGLGFGDWFRDPIFGRLKHGRCFVCVLFFDVRVCNKRRSAPLESSLSGV
jgi:hypothetical protein